MLYKDIGLSLNECIKDIILSLGPRCNQGVSISILFGKCHIICAQVGHKAQRGLYLAPFLLTGVFEEENKQSAVVSMLLSHSLKSYVCLLRAYCDLDTILCPINPNMRQPCLKDDGCYSSWASRHFTAVPRCESFIIL